MLSSVPSALTLVRLSVALLGMFNLALMLTGVESLHRDPSASKPRQIRVKDYPELTLLHLDTRPMRPRTLITEETAHYPVNGTLAAREWASLVPAENHGLVLLDEHEHEQDGTRRPYAVGMFHTLHCLDRIRRAIVGLPSSSSVPEDAVARYHVHHCFNYVRQMILCAADTRLNPMDHVLVSSGVPAADGIGLAYECRDWARVYEAFEANYALNRSMPVSFAR